MEDNQAGLRTLQRVMEAVREMKSSSAASCLRATGGFGRGSPPDKEKEHEPAGDGGTGEGFRRVPLGLVSRGRNWSSNTGGLVDDPSTTMDCSSGTPPHRSGTRR